jgi:hypothetical protein
MPESENTAHNVNNGDYDYRGDDNYENSHFGAHLHHPPDGSLGTFAVINTARFTAVKAAPPYRRIASTVGFYFHVMELSVLGL